MSHDNLRPGDVVRVFRPFLTCSTRLKLEPGDLGAVVSAGSSLATIRWFRYPDAHLANWNIIGTGNDIFQRVEKD